MGKETFCQRRHNLQSAMLPQKNYLRKEKQMIEIAFPHQLIVFGAPGTGKSWWIKEKLKALSEPLCSNNLQQLFRQWLPHNGVVSSAERYVKSLASISEEISGTHNQAEWPGCFELLIGHKPTKKVYEAASLLEFKRIYGAFEPFLYDNEARQGACPANLSKEFYNWRKIRGSGSGAGFMVAAFNKYKAFLQWRDEQKKCTNVIRTTFHPDSDYSTFVGAYKPSMEDDDFKTVVMTGEIGSAGNITKKDGLVTKKHIVYSFRAQAFLEAYVAAWRKCAAYLAATDEDSSKKATQFLVIEEINRGNCAQIFGDIFQLLDREDDGYSSYAINADNDLSKFVADSFRGDAAKGIPALDLTGVDLGDRDITPAEIASGDKLLLPPNLYIWATMNTSDQSLFPIDSAFKRRWAWKYIPISNANKNYSIEVGSDKYDWWKFLEKANALVESFTESEDKKLGYFFCKADNSGVISLEQFVGKVVFYLWNGVFKDTGFDDEVFDDGNGDKLYFKRFFDAKGNPDPAFVKKLMENLGVPLIGSQQAGTPPETQPSTETVQSQPTQQ